MQNDLNKLSDWSPEWLISLNIEKWKILHCKQSNPGKDYVMKDINNELTVLKTTRLEKDLGIIVSDDLKASTHCQTAAKKATRAVKLLDDLLQHKFKKLQCNLCCLCLPTFRLLFTGSGASYVARLGKVGGHPKKSCQACFCLFLGV